MKILVIKPSSLGDIVHALPTVNLIRHAHPHAHVAWLVNDSLAGILQNCPCINEIIPFPRAAFGRLGNLPRFFSFCRQLREKHFDIALDLQGLFRSGWLARASRAPRRIGLSDAREGARFFYTDIVPVPSAPTHAVERYLLALNALDIARGPIEFPLPSSPEDSAWAEKFLSPACGPLIAINPCARWDTKRWPPAHFSALIEQLVTNLPNVQCVLIGSPSDTPIAEAILSRTPSIVNAVGQTTLPQLVSLLRRCDLLITNDSGPMHIAAALGKPIVALFGPTDPALVGPYAADPARAPFTVLRAQGGMGRISVEEVLVAVRQRLKEFNQS